MFEFINYLRAIATVLITNSHFANIWPVRELASGGLLGNVIFLAVSGFLLFNMKMDFKSWFAKRFLRIYPALFVFTLFTVIIGKYPLNDIGDVIRLFVYPTNYIFIVWLFVCYMVLYVVAYMDKKYSNTLEITMLVIAVVWMFIYIVFYDKSAYTVDDVSKPFILFLYIESMLMGAYFKKHKNRFGKFSFVKMFITTICILIYFISKIAVSRIEFLLNFQIINQLVMVITLFSIFDLFMGMEKYLNKIPESISKAVGFISNITLQIYFVQFIVIARFEKLVFPLNLIVVISGILLLASVLYYSEKLVRKGIDNRKKVGKCKFDAEGTNQKN